MQLDGLPLFDSGTGLPDHLDPGELRFQQLKVSIHQRLVEALDLSQIGQIEAAQLQQHVERLVHEACDARPEDLDGLDRRRLCEDLMDEMFGLGPLEKLMHDPAISDVLVNGPYTVYVERGGRLELTGVIFADAAHLEQLGPGSPQDARRVAEVFEQLPHADGADVLNQIQRHQGFVGLHARGIAGMQRRGKRKRRSSVCWSPP